MVALSDSNIKGLSIAIFYAFISVALVFFNKSVLSVWNFRAPNMMTLCQMSFSLLMLRVLKATGIQQFAGFNFQTALQVWPLAFSFVGMVLTGLGALAFLTIPMFDALRRATTIMTMYSQWFLLGTETSTRVKLSVWIMVMGASIASLFDMQFNFLGYSLVLLNCVFTSGYLICISKFKHNLNKFGLMYYNNLLSMPVVIVICWAGGDFDYVANYEWRWHSGFLFAFAVQATLAFVLNYAIFLCTQTNSPLVTSVTGQVKNLVTTLAGLMFFPDVVLDLRNLFGLSVAFAGSLWYAWEKYTEDQNKRFDLPVAGGAKGKL